MLREGQWEEQGGLVVAVLLAVEQVVVLLLAVEQVVVLVLVVLVEQVRALVTKILGQVGYLVLVAMAQLVSPPFAVLPLLSEPPRHCEEDLRMHPQSQGGSGHPPAAAVLVVLAWC